MRRSLLAVLALIVALMLVGASVANAQPPSGEDPPPPPTCGLFCTPQDPNGPPPPPINPSSPFGRAFTQINERIAQLPAGPRRAAAERAASRVQNRLCQVLSRLC